MGNFAKIFWSQQHPVFPGGHPSKYWLGSMLLNFSDRTRTGVFNMIWPLAKKMSRIGFNNKHTYSHMHVRFCTQVRLKCCWLEQLRLFLQLPTGFLSISSSLKLLFRCFEHFCARNISKTRLRFAIWAFSSLRNQICSLKAGFSNHIKQNILSAVDKHHSNISWYFESRSCWLFSAHLDVLASAVHILILERSRED